MESNPDLLQEFIVESEKKIVILIEAFLLLQKDKNRLDQINQLLRCFHNLKSSAFNLCLPNIRRVAHLSEDLLVLVRENKVQITTEFLEILMQTISYCDEIIINLRQFGWEGKISPVQLIIRIKEFIEISIQPKENNEIIKTEISSTEIL